METSPGLLPFPYFPGSEDSDAEMPPMQAAVEQAVQVGTDSKCCECGKPMEQGWPAIEDGTMEDENVQEKDRKVQGEGR